MEIVKPKEISGKIMSLIEDAEKFVVIVSPYYKVSRWDKLTNVIAPARKRGIEFTFYVRTPESHKEYENIQEIESIGFIAIPIDRLHAKIYLNESEAIISSMNLHQGSDTGSIDIAVKTQTVEEYKEVYKFYEKYILSKGKETSYSIEMFLGNLDDALQNIFRTEPQIEYDESSITINARNRYEAFIESGRTSSLRMNCVLARKEFDYLKVNPNLFSISKLKIELQEGIGNNYDLIWGTLPNIQSQSFHSLQKEEAEEILNTLIGFIKGVEQMKDLVKNAKTQF